MSAPLLEVEAVGFRHGTRVVLDAVSFQAGVGEFLAILGANGAGKSTLLNLLAGALVPDAGCIRLRGQDLRQWPAAALARERSHLPQLVSTELPLTAGELVSMGRYPQRGASSGGGWGWFESEADRAAVQESMRRTGSLAWQDRPVGSLSGGERQRVLLAAVLAQEAGVLLLDEPSTFLDLRQQLSCFRLLREEAARGRLALAVTHDLNLALRFATRLLVLGEGRLAYDLTAAEAARDASWLRLFSPELELLPARAEGERPSVGYR